MEDDQVLVPPEVQDGLETLQRADALDPDDRQQALQAAEERDLGGTVRWLDQVGEEVYRRAATGAFHAEEA